MAEGYDIRPLDLDGQGLQKVTALLQQVFPNAEHFTNEVILWQYVQNPDGKAVGMNAWSGNELAGHYVTIPFKAAVDGKEEMGLLSLNTATHAEHRGKGLFTQLAKATYDAAKEAGFSFVVGVANANSTHGFTKKLGFQLVAQLKALVGTGRIPWKSLDSIASFRPVRNEAKLAWRLQHPAHQYTCIEQSQGSLCLSQKAMKGARFLLAAASQNEAFQLPVGPNPIVKAFVGLHPAIAWRRSLYLSVPDRLRPAPLNLIFKDLTGADRKLNAETVEFQAIDFDTM